MAATNVCPKCGFTNQAGWTYCTNCGGPLPPSTAAPWPAPPSPPLAYPAQAPPPAYPGYPAYPTYPAYPGTPPYAYGPLPWEVARQKQIRNTKEGVLLLLIGSLVSWLPYVGAFGSLLIFVGAILVIIGRRAFGPQHQRNVVISILFFIIGIAFSVVGGILAAFAALSVPMTSEAQLAAALLTALTELLVILAIGSAISGLASVFFTYALQTKEGRIVLWAAYGASIGIQLAILYVVFPQLPGIAATIAHQAITNGAVDSGAISNAITTANFGFNLLSVIPSVLYAAANYLAWVRINRGEIPQPTAPPGAPAMPAMTPPAPPINPV